ncbi:MAG: response regulator [Burkholderiaceae bacterium]|jgi:DNA-binding NarL/FixJ family response regulator
MSAEQAVAPAHPALRVLLVDDHTIVREGIRQVLNTQPGQWTIFEAESAAQAVDVLRQQEVDVVVLDITLPGMSGLDLISRIRRDHPRCAVLVLSMHSEDQYAVRALQAGANGYLTKNTAGAELLKAIMLITQGGVYLTPHLAERVVSQMLGHRSGNLLDTLSNRELDIFQRVVSGQRLTDIADALHLSIKTVSTHKKRIQDKLQVDSTAALIRYGLERGTTGSGNTDASGD